MDSRSRRRFVVLLLACAFALAAVGVARSGAVVTPPTGTPDLSQMVLQPSDFVSTTVISEGYQNPMGSVAVYGREFGPTKTSGGAQFLDIYSEVDLETDELSASLESGLLGAAVRTKAFRNQFAKELAKSSKSTFGVKVVRKNIHFGRVRSLNVGEDSSLLPITIRVKGRNLIFDLAFFRIDRALATLGLAPAPGAKQTDIADVARVMTADMKIGLSPTPTSLPAISGSPSPGATLSVFPGTWLNDPKSFTYLWERCDTTGAKCAPISGQTGLAYTVAPADVGATIRVAVVATNTVGSSKPTESVQTAVVH